MKDLQKLIKKEIDLRTRLDGVRVDILNEILPFLDFDREINFYIEYQSSDGLVLADDWTKIYHLPNLLSYIDKNGAIKSYDELKQFSI